MKRITKFLTLILLFCALVFCFACTPDTANNNDGENGENNFEQQDGETNSEQSDVEKINKNSSFELKFLEDVENKDLSGFTHHPGFGMTGYSNPKYDGGYKYMVDIFVLYRVTAYPDHSDGGQFVTWIYCSDPEVTFFGGCTISSGDAFLDAIEAEGYQIKFNQIEFGYDEYVAIKGNIKIRLNPNRYVIFDYEVSNRDGIVF